MATERSFCLQTRTGFEETPIRSMIADHGHLSERCFGRPSPILMTVRTIEEIEIGKTADGK